ncbi:MAG TPA: DUF1559 domain-containing protein [Gemmata sp.]|jgi:hypothetical protein|nr:DUF1559 domain-containing protein [Gemmata sp.]
MNAILLRAILPAILVGSVVAVPVSGGDDPPPITKKDLTTSMNNLKQIGLGIINYSDSNNGTMPQDITDKDGKPILSWRVALLPYMEAANLHQQFNLFEPWDSDTNKKLIEKIPKTYAPVRVKTKAGETFYQVFVGEKALFGPKNKPRYPASIIDGTSNTGMVFEAGEPVIWSKPADMPFDLKKPLPKLGGLFDGESHVGMCDGSVRRLKKNPDEDELKKLIMPADGSIIDFKKLDK